MGFSFRRKDIVDTSKYPSNSKFTSDREKVESVVNKPAVLRKKSIGERFVDLLDINKNPVLRHVLMEVVVPAAKDVITQAVTEGIERLVYGENRPVRRSGYAAYSSARPGYTSYSSYSTPKPAASQPARPEPQPVRSSRDVGSIVVSSVREAQDIHHALGTMLEKYGQVSVSDMFDLAGITPQHTDESWGWTDLSQVTIHRVADGYTLSMPPAVQLSRH